MILPTATYRLQFRNGMTFDRAAGLAPYLRRMGVSHLYASPIFTATAGSTHGYDMTDANEIDPAIGGRAGFERMAAALKAEELGIILDIVPNHMAASLENAWWRDVVEHGERSRYSGHFDIDWSRRLTLPFLGDTFEKALAAGEIAVARDPTTGRPSLVYFESHYPLNPDTYEGGHDLIGLTDRTAIAALHDRQSYRLMSWRDARRDLSYRRFFEITGLVGTRVEDEAVFDDMHRLILDLVRQGLVDGLRVDHVDGLADPKAYLERLREKAGPDCYITVEKILGEGETLPADWPVSGTTGYEFIAALNNVFVDERQMPMLALAHEKATGRRDAIEEELRKAKLLMVDHNFAGEFDNLVRMASRLAQNEDVAVSVSEQAIRSTLREVLICFEVYRTYGTARGLPDESRTVLAAALDSAACSGVANPDVLRLLDRILEGDVGEGSRNLASVFRTRFQQLTGPLMAKSVEDTLFFRRTIALALNEVGGDPRQERFSLERFHDLMQERLRTQPAGLTGTSTHDTKRAEDARARLFAILEAPGTWGEAVGRWREMNHSRVTALQGGPAPEPEVEWMLYQALAGVWPIGLDTTDEEGLGALGARFLPFVEKSLRESKLRTNWGDGDADYERAVGDYARWLLSPENPAFLEDFTRTLQPFIRAGLVNSLTQTVIKLTAPGIPDIYQGCEGLDFSLVDPDNRREPDLDLLAGRLDSGAPPPDAALEGCADALKQHVIRRVLDQRRRQPALFIKGDYVPLKVEGPSAEKVVAYARNHEGETMIVVAERLPLRSNSSEFETSGRWASTHVVLPAAQAGRWYRDVYSAESMQVGDELDLELAFRHHGFAVLLA
jgi:(1->4)-alpha-D-glucan 1-alpha-D-glucosylmutase